MKLRYVIPPGFKEVTHGRVKLGDYVGDHVSRAWARCGSEGWPVGDWVGQMDCVIRKVPLSHHAKAARKAHVKAGRKLKSAEEICRELRP